jgi:hypothetical protein
MTVVEDAENLHPAIAARLTPDEDSYIGSLLLLLAHFGGCEIAKFKRANSPK